MPYSTRLLMLTFMALFSASSGCDLARTVSAGGDGSAPVDGATVVDGGGLPRDMSVTRDAAGDLGVDARVLVDDSGLSWPLCATATGVGKTVSGAVDIIWFIDTSKSMKVEAAWLQTNLNSFATYIGGQKVDYRVIMIADNSICVPAPLGGANCSDGPRYRHVQQVVDSNDGLARVVDSYSKWQDFLRKDAAKNFVAVSDDDSDDSAAWFTGQLAKLTTPGFPQGFTFHSIVSFGTGTKGCSTGAAVGQVYLDLTTQTGGQKFQICEKDWASMFKKVAQGVLSTTRPPCTYTIPSPGAGKTLNPGMVEVSHVIGGKTRQMSRVASLAACAGASQWYYDDPKAPTSVVFCPKTCEALSGGKVVINFGCLP